MKAGIYSDLPMVEYIADPCDAPSLSTGVIHTLGTRSPIHAKAEHPRLGSKRDSGSNDADRGSAVHALALGGDQAIVWVDADDFRTKVAREARDAARASGRIPMLSRMRAPIEHAAAAVRATIDARFPGGQFEQTLIWEEGGVWHRSRPDYFTSDYVIDLKTTENADPGSWIKTTLNRSKMPLQAAHQLAGLSALAPGPGRDALWMVAEFAPPFGVSFVGLSPEYRDLAEKMRERAIKIWERCLRLDEWPGYSAEIHWADMPVWAAMDFEMRGTR